MKQLIRKNKAIPIAFVFLLLAVIGITFAYYSSKKDFENAFRTSKPGVAVHEIYDPTDFWVPGEEKSKKAWFSNSGESDMLLRFKVNVAWEEGISHPNREPSEFVTLYWKNSENTSTGTDGNEKKNPIKLTEANGREDFDFVLGPDGYYYYKKVLEAEGSKMAMTQNVLESVKFSEDLSNDGHKNSDYSNVQVNVTIRGETVLASGQGAAAVEEWKECVKNVTIDEQNLVTWTFSDQIKE